MRTAVAPRPPACSACRRDFWLVGMRKSAIIMGFPDSQQTYTVGRHQQIPCIYRPATVKSTGSIKFWCSLACWTCCQLSTVAPEKSLGQSAGSTTQQVVRATGKICRSICSLAARRTHHETYIPTLQSQARTYARLSHAHEDAWRPRSHCSASRQGPQAPGCLVGH